MVWFRDDNVSTKRVKIYTCPKDTSAGMNFYSDIIARRYDAWTDYSWDEWYSKGESLVFYYQTTNDNYWGYDSTIIYPPTKIRVVQIR